MIHSLGKKIVAFSVSAALGWIVVSSWGARGTGETRAARQAGEAGEHGALLSALTSRKVQPFEERLHRQRQMAAMPMDEFPSYFESVFRHSSDLSLTDQVIRAWIERDPEHYLAWLRTQPASPIYPEGPRNRAIDLQMPLLHVLLEQDPRRAWEVADSLPGTRATRRLQLLNQMFTTGADVDVMRNLVRERRDTMSDSLSLGGPWETVDPMLQLPVFLELHPGYAQEGWASEAAQYYTRKGADPVARKAWFDALPPHMQAAVGKNDRIPGDPFGIE
jgi:hypothetical protein